MELLDIVNRVAVPDAWAEGDNIPWHEPGFSERMLLEHLSQDHDAASRRYAIIDEHILWLHRAVLGAQPTKILDLGCGPGFYSTRLARLGHTCVGIDYSPASVAYARELAASEGLACTFVESDIRAADYGDGYGLIMLIFGEFNIFKPADARLILNKARAALAPDGILVLEPHTFAAVEGFQNERRFWYSSHGELFSAAPHLVLTESFWDPGERTATRRFFVVDAASGAVERYAHSFQAYTEEEYCAVLAECGFTQSAFFPSLGGKPIAGQEDYCAIIARPG